LGDGEAFLRAYEQQSGQELDRSAIPFWQLLATTRWAVIALHQAERAYRHGENSLELALTAEIVPSLEWDILDLLDRMDPIRSNADEDGGAASQTGPAELDPGKAADHRAAALLRIAQMGFQDSIRPRIKGEDRYTAAMIGRALDVSVRRISEGPRNEGLEKRAIARLIGSRGSESLSELRSDLCKLIRRGGFDDTAGFALRTAMRSWVEGRLAVSDPGYLRSLAEAGISVC
jgi:hypothetical protein